MEKNHFKHLIYIITKIKKKKIIMAIPGKYNVEITKVPGFLAGEEKDGTYSAVYTEGYYLATNRYLDVSATGADGVGALENLETAVEGIYGPSASKY